MQRLVFIICMTIFITISFTHIAGAEENQNDVYKVGINDVIRIEVMDHSNLRAVNTIASDGTITFPYLGNIYVKDMSLSEIEKEITKGLSDGYVKYPVVTVTMVTSKSKKVFTYGEIRKLGVVPFEENMTLVKAMSYVGGVSADGMYGKIRVRRMQEGESSGYRDIVEAKLNDGAIEKREVEDMLLKPDDILIVERNKTFLIQGQMLKLGKFVLEKDMTVVRALLQAGGVSADGLYGKIKVRRKQEGDHGGYRDIAEAKLNDGVIESKEVEDMILQPDDILMVERNKTFLIQGEVFNHGKYVLEKDMTVIRALLQAGGVSGNGLYGKIKVRRKQKGDHGGYRDITEAKLNDGAIEKREVEDMILQPDDILIVERNKTFLIQGEMSQRGKFILEKDMTVIRALLQAGGVSGDGLHGKIKVRRKQESEQGGYRDIIEAKLNDGVIESKEVEDMILQPDDILIAERNKTFFIYGEARKTGEFVLKGDMKVFEAITIAGGFTKWGSGNQVKLLRHEMNKKGFKTINVDINDVIDGDAGADVNLQPGDMIIVSSGIF